MWLEMAMAPSRFEPVTLRSTERLFLALFFWLSQPPGEVALWYNHPKSRPVSLVAILWSVMTLTKT